MEINKIYHDLIDNYKTIKVQFLAIHLNDRTTDVSVFKNDVKAFCNLFHAILEDYFKDVAYFVLTKSIYIWETERKINIPLLTMICYSNLSLEIKTDNEELRVSDYIRKIVNEAKTNMSKLIYNSNGIERSAICKYLSPLALDFLNDIRIEPALTKIKRERDTFKAIRHKSLTPEDADKFAKDCLLFCNWLINRAYYLVSSVNVKNLLLKNLVQLIKYKF